MRHIEKSRRRADVNVLFQDSVRVLNGHLISRKGNHPSAEIAVQLVQRGVLKSLTRNDAAHDSTCALQTGAPARDAKNARAVRIRRLGSIKTEDMRGTSDPTPWSIYVVPPL
jgi:hypothetical protein